MCGGPSGQTGPTSMATTRDNRKDQLQGTLDLLVLRTLSTGGTMHGYAITERVEQVSREVLRIEAGIALSRAAPHGRGGLAEVGLGAVRQQPPRPLLHHHRRRGGAGSRKKRRIGRAWTGAVGRVLKQA